MQVTEYNVGRWCLSEDECNAQGIDFAAYERGVADAAKAFGQNAAAQLVAASPAAAEGVPTDTNALLAAWNPPEPVNFPFDPKKPKPDGFAAYTVMQLHRAFADGVAAASPVAPAGVPRDEQIEQVWFDNARDGRMLYGQFFAAARALLSAGVPLPTARTQSAPPAPNESEGQLPRTDDSAPQEQWLDRYPTYCGCQLCLAAQSRL